MPLVILSQTTSNHYVHQFFNLFSEAAIWIAHGTKVFWRGLLRHDGSKFKAEGQERGSWQQTLFVPIKSL